MIDLSRLREAFAGFEEDYVIIGGTACELHLDVAGFSFRATKDIDMVLAAQTLSKDFATRIFSFVTDGGYELWTRKETGQQHFYRFEKPTADGFPYMLELFGARPDELENKLGELTRLKVGDEWQSLSAIVLNTEYMDFVRGGMQVKEGLSILGVEHLIPMKAYAHLDLAQRKEGGESVRSVDVKKHKNDVFRLAQVADPQWQGSVPDLVTEHVAEFISKMRDEAVDLKALRIPGELETILDLLETLYVPRETA